MTCSNAAKGEKGTQKNENFCHHFLQIPKMGLIIQSQIRLPVGLLAKTAHDADLKAT